MVVDVDIDLVRRSLERKVEHSKHLVELAKQDGALIYRINDIENSYDELIEEYKEKFSALELQLYDKQGKIQQLVLKNNEQDRKLGALEKHFEVEKHVREELEAALQAARDHLIEFQRMEEFGKLNYQSLHGKNKDKSSKINDLSSKVIELIEANESSQNYINKLEGNVGEYKSRLLELSSYGELLNYRAEAQGSLKPSEREIKLQNTLKDLGIRSDLIPPHGYSNDIFKRHYDPEIGSVSILVQEKRRVEQKLREKETEINDMDTKNRDLKKKFKEMQREMKTVQTKMTDAQTKEEAAKNEVVIVKRENDHLKFDLHRDARLGNLPGHQEPGLEGLPPDVNLLETHETATAFRHLENKLREAQVRVEQLSQELDAAHKIHLYDQDEQYVLQVDKYKSLTEKYKHLKQENRQLLQNTENIEKQRVLSLREKDAVKQDFEIVSNKLVALNTALGKSRSQRERVLEELRYCLIDDEECVVRKKENRRTRKKSR